MKGRRILFQDPDPRTLRAAERALVATGAEVDVVQVGQAAQAVAVAGGARLVAAAAAHATVLADVPALVRRIDEVDPDLVMMNFDPPVRADPRWNLVFDRLAARPPRCGVVLHATAASEDYLPLLAERPFVQNLIAKNDEPLDPEELITTAAKLLRGDLFGLEKYLLWGVAPVRLTVRDSRDKHAHVRAVAAYAERVGCPARLLALVEAIADELITNAIYNAPRDAAGRPKYAAVPRRSPVVLEPDEVAELAFACDGNYIGVSLTDPFGALTRDTIVAYLNRCLVRAEPLEATFASSGAGIGLYRIFQSLSKFIVNLDPGRRSEVIALVDVRHSMKKFRQAPKSFHIFVADPARRAEVALGGP